MVREWRETVCSQDEDHNGCEGSGWVDHCGHCGYGWVSGWHHTNCPYAGTNEVRYTCGECDGRGVVERLCWSR